MGRLIDTDSVKFTDFEIVMCEGDFKKAFKLLCEKLDDAPTVDAEPVRHGHWINGEPISGVPYKRCTQCFCEVEATFFGESSFDVNYCPNCGSKMLERREDEIN